MPMIGSVGQRIQEFRGGKTYARTKAKYGARTANRQSVAAAMASVGRSIGDIAKDTSKKK